MSDRSDPTADDRSTPPLAAGSFVSGEHAVRGMSPIIPTSGDVSTEENSPPGTSTSSGLFQKHGWKKPSSVFLDKYGKMKEKLKGKSKAEIGESDETPRDEQVMSVSQQSITMSRYSPAPSSRAVHNLPTYQLESTIDAESIVITRSSKSWKRYVTCGNFLNGLLLAGFLSGVIMSACIPINEHMYYLGPTFIVLSFFALVGKGYVTWFWWGSSATHKVKPVTDLYEKYLGAVPDPYGLQSGAAYRSQDRKTKTYQESNQSWSAADQSEGDALELTSMMHQSEHTKYKYDV